VVEKRGKRRGGISYREVVRPGVGGDDVVGSNDGPSERKE